MTWAIVRKGVIVDHAEHSTLWALAHWLEERRASPAETVMMDLRPGEVARIGARVEVSDLSVQRGELTQGRR